MGSFSGKGSLPSPRVPVAGLMEGAGGDERAGAPAREGIFPDIPDALPEARGKVPGEASVFGWSRIPGASPGESGRDFVGFPDGTGYPCGGFPDASPPEGDGGTGGVSGAGCVLRRVAGEEDAGPTTSDRRSAGSGQTPS